jgi:hypothetical protein
MVNATDGWAIGLHAAVIGAAEALLRFRLRLRLRPRRLAAGSGFGGLLLVYLLCGLRDLLRGSRIVPAVSLLFMLGNGGGCGS